MKYILNWFYKSTGAFGKVIFAISEGFNNKIKRLKRRAYGYKDINYFRLKIHQSCPRQIRLWHCGLLNPFNCNLNKKNPKIFLPIVIRFFTFLLVLCLPIYPIFLLHLVVEHSQLEVLQQVPQKPIQTVSIFLLASS